MSSEPEKTERIEAPFKIFYLPVMIPWIDVLGWLAKAFPEEHKAALSNLIDAEISIYKAINSFIEVRMKNLEKFKEELEKPKKEKVKVE